MRQPRDLRRPHAVNRACTRRNGIDRVEDVVVRVRGRERQRQHLVAGALGDRQRAAGRGSARGTRSAGAPAGSGCSSPISSSPSACWYSSRVAPARRRRRCGRRRGAGRGCRAGRARAARSRRGPRGPRRTARTGAPGSPRARSTRSSWTSAIAASTSERFALKPGRDLVVERPVAAAREPHVPDRLGDVVAVRRDEPALAGGDVLRRVEREAGRRRRCRRPCGRGSRLSAACAASSTTGRPSARIGSRSAGCPARWTGMIAFVRSVTSAGISAGSMLRSPSRTSQKTGVAPQCSITFAVAGQVIGLVITSSPGPTPSARSARWSAAVPEVTASTCSASRYAAQRSSSSAARGPGRQPARAQRLGDGGDLLLADRGRLEAELGATTRSASTWKRTACAARRARAERLGARRPGGEHRAGPVGAAPQRPEHAARLAVDPHPLDALGRLGLLDARPRCEHARPAGRGRGRTPTRRSVPAAAARHERLVRFGTGRRRARTTSARAFRSTPVAARQSSASWPPPSRAATSTT